MSNLREKIWLWGQRPGSHHFDYNLPGENKMTPTEGLSFFGIDNLCRVKMSREAELSFLDDPYLGEPAKKICLSLIGSGGEVPKLDMEPILTLAKDEPRIVSAVMDDFISAARMEAFPPEVLQGFKDRLHNTLDRKLDLWSVIYEVDLEKPIAERARIFDVTTFWIWKGENLAEQEQYIKRMGEIVDGGRMMLGIYLYDYGNKRQLTEDQMRRQLDVVGNKLATGEVEGAILCSNCCADLGFPTVDIALDWLNQL